MAAVVGGIAAGLFTLRLALFVALHLRPGDIHPLRDTVSDYAVSTSLLTRRLATAASWAAAAAWIALGIALSVDDSLGHQRHATGTWVLVLGAILVVMPLIPTDRGGIAQTTRGRIHLIAAIAWFAIAYSTIGPLRHLAAADAVRATLGPLQVIAAISLGALIISLILPQLRQRTFGVCERIFIAAATLAPTIFSYWVAMK